MNKDDGLYYLIKAYEDDLDIDEALTKEQILKLLAEELGYVMTKKEITNEGA